MARAVPLLIVTLIALPFAAPLKAEEGMTSTPQVSKSLLLERSFKQPPEIVWRAWTDPDWVAGWAGSDPKGKVLTASTDVRPGGKFEVRFADSDGTEHTFRGIYREVEPWRSLTFTWSWESEPGTETFVSVRLTAQGLGTLMRFEHSGLGQASTHDYEFGWRSTFEKMQRVIDSRVGATKS